MLAVVIERTVLEQEQYRRFAGRPQTGPRSRLQETDRLLEQLERITAAGIRTTPPALVAWANSLFWASSPQLLAQLARERRPAQVQELVYQLQQELMEECRRSRRLGPRVISLPRLNQA